MNWKVLKTEEEYKRAVDRLEEIIEAEPGTGEFDELELLGLLVKDYEDKYYPAQPLDPIQVIKLRMEEMGLKNKDLASIIGSEPHVSAVLKGKRQLTLSMARALSRYLKIPANVFINDHFGFDEYGTAENSYPMQPMSLKYFPGHCITGSEILMLADREGNFVKGFDCSGSGDVHIFERNGEMAIELVIKSDKKVGA